MFGSKNNQNPPQAGGSQSQPQAGNQQNQPQAGGSQPDGVKEGQGAGKAAAFRYRCTEDCTFQGKFRRKGDIVVLAEKKDPPHFEFVAE